MLSLAPDRSRASLSGIFVRRQASCPSPQPAGLHVSDLPPVAFWLFITLVCVEQRDLVLCFGESCVSRN